MVNKILTFVLLISVGLMSKGYSQTVYDSKLISTDKELNFASTDKRGIKDDNGIVYFVEKDGQTLAAYNGNEIKWTVNIIKTCGVPTVGKPEIRYLKLTQDKIEIVFGKHDYASVDVRDGKAKYLGAD